MVAGGLGKPAGLDKGFLRESPRCWGHVNNQMDRGARGDLRPGGVHPGLRHGGTRRCRSPTTRRMAWRPMCRAPTWDATRKVASRLRAGQVNLNSAAPDLMAPFRRVQAVGQWPGMGRARVWRVPGDQGGAGVCGQGLIGCLKTGRLIDGRDLGGRGSGSCRALAKAAREHAGLCWWGPGPFLRLGVGWTSIGGSESPGDGGCYAARLPGLVAHGLHRTGQVGTVDLRVFAVAVLL